MRKAKATEIAKNGLFEAFGPILAWVDLAAKE